MTHKSVFDQISDDGVPGVEHMEKYVNAFLHNVGTYVLMPILGMVTLYVPVNHVMYDIHVASIKNEVHRRKIRGAMLDSLLWMADRTSVQKYIISVPVIYPAAASICRKMRFTKEGHLTSAYLKNGNLCDIELYCTSRSDVLKQRR